MGPVKFALIFPLLSTTLSWSAFSNDLCCFFEIITSSTYKSRIRGWEGLCFSFCLHDHSFPSYGFLCWNNYRFTGSQVAKIAQRVLCTHRLAFSTGFILCNCSTVSEGGINTGAMCVCLMSFDHIGDSSKFQQIQVAEFHPWTAPRPTCFLQPPCLTPSILMLSISRMWSKLTHMFYAPTPFF